MGIRVAWAVQPQSPGYLICGWKTVSCWERPMWGCDGKCRPSQTSPMLGAPDAISRAGVIFKET